MKTIPLANSRISQATNLPSTTGLDDPAKALPTTATTPHVVAPGQFIANGAMPSKLRVSSSSQFAPRMAMASVPAMLQALVDKAHTHHAHHSHHHPHHRRHLPPPASPQPSSRTRRRATLSARSADHDHEHEVDDLHEEDHLVAPRASSTSTGNRTRNTMMALLGHQRAEQAEEAAKAQRAAKSDEVRLDTTGGLKAIMSGRRSSSSGRGIPNDGSSFMNSLVHLASSALRKHIQLPTDKALDAPLLRRKLAEHLVDTLAKRNAEPSPDARKPLAGARNAQVPTYNFRSPSVQGLFVATLGEPLAKRCEGFSDAQKTQVLDMATGPAPNAGPQRARALADILPSLATGAFPGLRLEVHEPGQQEPARYGQGDEPALVLRHDPDTGRYEPAEEAQEAAKAA